MSKLDKDLENKGQMNFYSIQERSQRGKKKSSLERDLIEVKGHRATKEVVAKGGKRRRATLNR